MLAPAPEVIARGAGRPGRPSASASAWAQLLVRQIKRQVSIGSSRAPESVGRRCAKLRGPRADLAHGPRLVHGALAFWMQTTGASLLAVSRCSLGVCRRLPRTAVARMGCCISLLYGDGRRKEK